jgi:hypothetical protein
MTIGYRSVCNLGAEHLLAHIKGLWNGWRVKNTVTLQFLEKVQPILEGPEAASENACRKPPMTLKNIQKAAYDRTITRHILRIFFIQRGVDGHSRLQKISRNVS